MIAEGDVLTMSISRHFILFVQVVTVLIGNVTELTAEILRGRISLPPSRHPECLLAKHETGLLDECRKIFLRSNSQYQSEEYNSLILPLSLPLVESIGYRMAYEAALEAKIHQPLLDLYEAGIVSLDPGWYIENVGLTRAKQHKMEFDAINAAAPNIRKYLAETGAEPFFRQIPMLSKGNWEQYVERLEAYSGNSTYSVTNDNCKVGARL